MEVEIVETLAAAVEQQQTRRATVGGVAARGPFGRAEFGSGGKEFIVRPRRTFACHGLTQCGVAGVAVAWFARWRLIGVEVGRDRKSTRLNSSHVKISYAV